MVEEDASKPIFSQTRAQETDLPYTVRLNYAEADLDYRNASVAQRKFDTGSSRELSANLSAAVSQSLAQQRVDVALQEAWVQRETAQFSLPPSLETVEPGDVLRIGNNPWRIKSIIAGAHRKIDAYSHDAGAYNPPPAVDRKHRLAAPQIFGKPEAHMLIWPWLMAVQHHRLGSPRRPHRGQASWLCLKKPVMPASHSTAA